jgi:hypothetical protein
MPKKGYIQTIEEKTSSGKGFDAKDFKSRESRAALSELLRRDNERAGARAGNMFRDAEHEEQRRSTFGKHR